MGRQMRELEMDTALKASVVILISSVCCRIIDARTLENSCGCLLYVSRSITGMKVGSSNSWKY